MIQYKIFKKEKLRQLSKQSQDFAIKFKLLTLIIKFQKMSLTQILLRHCICLGLLSFMHLLEKVQCDGRQHEIPYSPFLNYGTKRLKPGIEILNEVHKNKIELLGELLKKHVQRLRKVR